MPDIISKEMELDSVKVQISWSSTAAGTLGFFLKVSDSSKQILSISTYGRYLELADS